ALSWRQRGGVAAQATQPLVPRGGRRSGVVDAGLCAGSAALRDSRATSWPPRNARAGRGLVSFGPDIARTVAGALATAWRRAGTSFRRGVGGAEHQRCTFLLVAGAGASFRGISQRFS